MATAVEVSRNLPTRYFDTALQKKMNTSHRLPPEKVCHFTILQMGNSLKWTLGKRIDCRVSLDLYRRIGFGHIHLCKLSWCRQFRIKSYSFDFFVNCETKTTDVNSFKVGTVWMYPVAIIMQDPRFSELLWRDMYYVATHNISVYEVTNISY